MKSTKMLFQNIKPAFFIKNNFLFVQKWHKLYFQTFYEYALHICPKMQSESLCDFIQFMIVIYVKNSKNNNFCCFFRKSRVY